MRLGPSVCVSQNCTTDCSASKGQANTHIEVRRELSKEDSISPVLMRCLTAILLLGTISYSVCAQSRPCLKVPAYDKDLKIDPTGLKVLAKASIDEAEVYELMQYVSGFETNGCWAGATGSFDRQMLSTGVMQWSFGQGTVQPLLKTYRERFKDQKAFESEVRRVMPNYGANFLDVSCREIPLSRVCNYFLQKHLEGKSKRLSPDLKLEVDNLFESPLMRQIQLDYFTKSIESVLDDINRVFQTRSPAKWQVAWAMDLKTQQGRFPTDKKIKAVKAQFASETREQRRTNLKGDIEWYVGLCQSGEVTGVSNDWEYNKDNWNRKIDEGKLDKEERYEALQYSQVKSRTAQANDGEYQADAFQRLAAIIFDGGSVHGIKTGLPK